MNEPTSSDHDRDRDLDDERTWRRLEGAIGPDAGRAPSDERIAALRAAAEHRRAPAAPAEAEADSEPAQVRRLPVRSRRFLVAGGIAAAVGGIAGFAARDLSDGEPVPEAGPPTEPIAFAGGEGVRSDAALVNHTWGTELMLEVEGLETGTVHDVVYRGRDGSTVQAGSLLAVDGPMTCRFNAATLRADLAGILVRRAGGGSALEVQLPRA